VERAAGLLPILEIPISDLHPETGNTNFSVSSELIQINCLNITLKRAKQFSMLVISNLVFSDPCTIRQNLIAGFLVTFR
jgi:hypothetical protein